MNQLLCPLIDLIQFLSRNHRVLLGKQEHVTRFISLAPFLNKDSKKVNLGFFLKLLLKESVHVVY